MTTYGLTESELGEIVFIFSKYPEIESVVLFGSRAMGNFKEASDVDIAVLGKNVNFSVTTDLKSDLEDETDIPYFFDVIGYNTISNLKLKKHIDELGKIIYEKK